MKIRNLLLIVVLLGTVGSISLSFETSASASSGLEVPAVDFDSVWVVPHDWRKAILLALIQDAELLQGNTQFMATSGESYGPWFHVVITPRYIVDARWEVPFSWDEVIEVVGQRKSTNEYIAYLINSQRASSLKAQIPTEFMDFASEASAQAIATAPLPLFPWTSGQIWYKTWGWHDGYWGLPNNAIDIAPVRSSNPGRDYAVLAPTSGRVTRLCQDSSDQAVLKIETDHGTFGFLHLRNSTIPSAVLNQDVPRGRYLGYLYDTGGSYNSYCGYGTGVHLHFTLPRRDIPIDGHSAESVAGARNQSPFQSSNQRTDTNAEYDNDGGDIGYGQTRYGTINPAYDTDDFYFNASAGDIVEIRQDKNNSSLDSFVELSGPNNFFASDDDGGGNLNSYLRRTLPASGRYRIRAKGYGSSTGAYRVSLARISGGCTQDCQGENRWISFGQTLYETINPANDRDTYYFSGTAGRVISIRMNRTGGDLDSFLELWSPSNVRVADNDDGGGDRNSWIVYTLPNSGTYRISAYSWNNASTGSYSLRLESITGGGGSGNLARGRPVAVSSVEFSGVEGWRATDGNITTRWSSRFSDPQWIYVDLGQDRYFNQVVLKWETAYGRSFGIYYQSTNMCSYCWNRVYWTDSGHGGTNTINFGRVFARYILMYGTARGTPWGYSLWEFEVYDTTTTTVPLVPPDDPEKGENTAPLEVPLPPTEGDKEVILAGNGEYGQEETPLAGGNAIEITEALNGIQSVVAFIVEPAELGYHGDLQSSTITFLGEATSQVNGIDVPIVAYRWRSDRQGEIGTQAAFTLPITALLPGMHTIYFKAQNELGTWSDEVSARLFVERPYQVLLPMVMR